MPDITPTERLYFADAYLREFEGRVVALTEYHGQPAVVLDATAFYPEGGGQPADLGTLGGVGVRDVQEEGDVIYHILAEPLPVGVGDVVRGEIDWARRYDFMQQHSGQHTISGAFYRLMGANTTSWHLTPDSLNIEIDRAGLSVATIAEAEHAANEILWQNVPITAQFYSREEMAALGMRKGSDREGAIRVVSIGDWDRIGCGGTHVATAGQVGQISLRRWEAKGALTRIEFVCGARAVAEAHRKTLIVNAACTALSSKPDEVGQQIDRLIIERDEQRRTIASLQKRLIEYEARDLLSAATEMIDDHPLICARLDDRDMNDLRFMAQRLAELGGVALIGGASEGKAQMVFACDKSLSLDLNQTLKAALPLIGGKGGGQKSLAQGGGPEISHLDAALAQARASLREI